VTEAFLTRQRESTNAVLAEITRDLPDNAVGNAMRYSLAGDGKRLRPALCVACYRALGGDDNPAVQHLAAALEIIHTYSLVHDDLPCMDNDDVRRGRETTHRAFGNEVAIMAGAALIPLAFRVAAQALDTLGKPAGLRSRVHAQLAASAGAAGMVGGQLLDLQGDAHITDAVQLERIHSAKTGALIEAACVVGALAGDANDRQLAAVAAYARHLGLAFQIADDVLDETGSTAQLGKTAGKDRDVAKATYPALLGLAGARERAIAEADAARQALARGGITDPLLRGLAVFAIERSR
jgi:geranylgeranyl pyrophosphate synthase